MDELKVKKAAMTGACGPIGLALLRLLLDKGIKVLVFQREESVRRFLLPVHPNLEVAYYDLAHIQDYDVKNKDFDAFFHLGWANTWHEYRERLDKQMENVSYTCNAVEIAHKLGCKVFVGVGSQAEYGRKNEPLRYDMLCEPETPYGIMKLAACYSSEHLCHKYGIRHIWARVLSAYGYFDNPHSVIIGTIRNSKKNVELPFSKGEQIWDFLHMNDVASALLLLSIKGRDGIKYPIGSGEKKQLANYIDIMGSVLECQDKIKMGVYPYKDNSITFLSADITKLEEDTGWKQMIPFDKGIAVIAKFYQKWDTEGNGIYWNKETKKEIYEQGYLWDEVSSILEE